MAFGTLEHLYVQIHLIFEVKKVLESSVLKKTYEKESLKEMEKF